MDRKDAGFARIFRLVKAAEFKHVFQQPSKSADNALLVMARKNSLGYARLGLAISIKSAETAVARNRIKRVARESFRRCLGTLGGVDFIVSSRGGVAKKTNTELRLALERHWLNLANAKNPHRPD